MCILIHQPKDYCFTAEHLADFYGRNPDGFGAIVNHADERGVVVYKIVGTLKEIEDLYFNSVACYEAIIHFRMKTHGDIDMDNCHPYQVTDGLWMAHNGILSSGNSKDPKKSDTWHYINDFIKPMLETTPSALENPYIRGYIGVHIGASNKFGFMDNSGQVFIINKHSGVEYDGVWFSNTYAWTPWKHGYEKAPAYANNAYGGAYHTSPNSKSYTRSQNYYGSSSSWRYWNELEESGEYAEWEAEGYRSPSVERKQQSTATTSAQAQLPWDGKAKSKANRQRVQRAKAKAKAKANKAAVQAGIKRDNQPSKSRFNPKIRLSTEALARIIRSSYNAMMTEDYYGVIRWVSENPMKASALLYEMYGNEEDKKFNSEALSDRINVDPNFGADAIIDMWAEHEDMLLDLAGITKPNSSKGEHSYVQ